ncbi:hypothetical protein ACJMK2_014900 [Sinanodonta woodiana]|uniref:KY-like immunoglobulin-like domain-containing protein n=1 Tax=Sinanodonta woodiana TaxID=1069815 RepID=A0ABD3V216_SINWO
MEKTNDDSSSNVSDTSTVPFPVVKVKVKLNEENETTLSIKIRFQEAGKYKVEIVGKERQVKNADNEFDWIAIFNVHVKKINWNKREGSSTERIGAKSKSIRMDKYKRANDL